MLPYLHNFQIGGLIYLPIGLYAFWKHCKTADHVKEFSRSTSGDSNFFTATLMKYLPNWLNDAVAARFHFNNYLCWESKLCNDEVIVRQNNFRLYSAEHRISWNWFLPHRAFEAIISQPQKFNLALSGKDPFKNFENCCSRAFSSTAATDQKIAPHFFEHIHRYKAASVKLLIFVCVGVFWQKLWKMVKNS